MTNYIMSFLCRPFFYLHASEIFLTGEIFGFLELLEALHGFFCVTFILLSWIFCPEPRGDGRHRKSQISSILGALWKKSWLKARLTTFWSNFCYSWNEFLSLLCKILSSPKRSHNKRRKSRYCCRYYVRGVRHRTNSRVATKQPRNKPPARFQALASATTANEGARNGHDETREPRNFPSGQPFKSQLTTARRVV